MTAVVVFAAAAVVSIVLLARNARAEALICQFRSASTPVDHAQRILAGRFARGQITAEEYERMLAVLHR